MFKERKEIMIYVIYHKNCMDGVSSAYIAHEYLKFNGAISLIPLNYGDEFNIKQLSKEDTIYMVDFSFKRDYLIDLSKLVKNIIIIDHHKTAQADLINLPENIEVNFDMSESGATLTFDYFNSKLKYEDKKCMPEIFSYIRDRDCWLWKLPYSREVSEYLAFSIIPNDIKSFADVVNNFNIDDAISVGSILLKKKAQQIDSKILKVRDIVLHNIEFKAINVTENISELGNEIIIEYNKPALLYFIAENNEVICSMRSANGLADVSEVAKLFGGGGHRNAAGFKTNLETLIKIIE